MILTKELQPQGTVCTVRKAYKYKLRPTEEQAVLFAKTAGCCRLVWNKVLGINKDLLNYKPELFKNYNQTAKFLPTWKSSVDFSFLREVPSQALQQKLKDLQRAFDNFFRKVQDDTGFPNFKKKGVNDSFRIPNACPVDGNRIKLPKAGWVRFFKSREVEGEIKNVTVTRQLTGWFMSVQVEQQVELNLNLHPSTTAIGIDVGICNFATTSDGEVIEPINIFRKTQKKLAKAQRHLKRKVKFSSNWKKEQRKISKIHHDIANIRKDFLHKTSTRLSKNHALIVIEDLQISNMTKSAKGTLANPGKNVSAKSGLNKSILDQGWGMFRQFLEYKQFWNGGLLVAVNPQYTSQTCPICGFVSKDNRKTQSKFKCLKCGHVGNADVVAARNILAAGQSVLACREMGSPNSMKQEPELLAPLDQAI